MLADQGLLVDGRWQGTVDVEIEIPPTLRSLLAARLDRLETPARILLDRASVEGRRFRLGAVRALAPELDDQAIDTLVAALDRGGLLQPEDEPRGRWRFAHPLIFEATYRGVPKTLRSELHEGLADWLAVEDIDQADVDESVARHLERPSTSAASSASATAAPSTSCPLALLRLADDWVAEIPAWDWDLRVRREVISARCQLIRGDLAGAAALARRGVQLAEASDALHDRVAAYDALANVLDAQGRGEEALATRRAGLECLRAKRNWAAVERAEAEIARRLASA